MSTMHLALTYSMSRLFAYARVSTSEQTADNQLREITAAGFCIERKRTLTESISGSVAANRRPGFTKLLDRMEEGDALVVTKLDRFGRNTMDMSYVRSLRRRRKSALGFPESSCSRWQICTFAGVD